MCGGPEVHAHVPPQPCLQAAVLLPARAGTGAVRHTRVYTGGRRPLRGAGERGPAGSSDKFTAQMASLPKPSLPHLLIRPFQSRFPLRLLAQSHGPGWTW